MINNRQKIKELTNLEIGKVTVNGSELNAYCDNDQRDKGFVYDENTYNFHLLPEDEEIFEEISDEILNKKKSLLDVIKQKVLKYNLNWSLENENNSGNLYNLKNKTNEHYKTSGNLFCFIRVRVEGLIYDINFNRFYIEDNKINCQLFTPQFSCIKCNPGYPNSSKNKAYSFGSMYYNPTANFMHEDDLIEEFIDFVNNVSKKMI